MSAVEKNYSDLAIVTLAFNTFFLPINQHFKAVKPEPSP
jgi:hypothetical protein